MAKNYGCRSCNLPPRMSDRPLAQQKRRLSVQGPELCGQKDYTIHMFPINLWNNYVMPSNKPPRLQNCKSFRCVDCPKGLEERYSHSEVCCDLRTHEEHQTQDTVALGDAERIREDWLQLIHKYGSYLPSDCPKTIFQDMKKKWQTEVHQGCSMTRQSK